MKITLNIFLILFFIQLIFTNSTFPFEVKDKNEYLIDVRGDDGDIYLNRFSLHKKLGPPETEANFFTEAQWNFNISEWEKITFGIEINKSFWQRLYIGQSLQCISGQMLDYINLGVQNSSLDTTTKIGLQLPFLKNFSLCAFEEYSLNLEKGKGEYCDTWAKIIYSPQGKYSIGLGWHHTDRVHNFDSDYISTSFTLRF